VKFFKGVTKLIDDEVKESAFKVFERISYDISDMYLKVIVDLQFRYSEVECQVLHSRNTDLCKLFYAKRQQYIQKLSRQGRITLYDGKLDAVIDYITMLALPYYVYGTKNVLQIDSVDEADSMRKCMKVHSSDVTFHSILFPEYLCEDGVHTIFNAPLEFKDYISTGG
jgi:Mg2+ and Co2+ transporter CorA